MRVLSMRRGPPDYSVDDPESDGYDPIVYWNQRVAGGQELSRVGHQALGAYNRVSYRLRRRALQIALHGLLPNWPRVRVFEAGFGVGYYLRYFERSGVADVTGIDLSAGAVEAAQRRFPGFKLSQQDASEPISETIGQYDLVTAIDVLYHIVDDSRWHRALENLCSLVAPGGALIVTDKFPASLVAFDQAPHVRRRSLQMYRSVLENHGFTIRRRVPVFLFMDDPITCGRRQFLGHVSSAQWRLISKSIRVLGRWPVIRDLVAFALAWAQYPVERAVLAFVTETPNLEMLVATRTVRAS